MGKKLKKCPFCGKDEGDIVRNDDGDYIVRCGNCGAMGPWRVYEDDAIEEWNTRKEEDV